MDILIVLNLVAGVVMILVINSKRFPFRRFGLIGRGGVWLGASGLVLQSFRTAYNMKFGAFPLDDYPVWVLKDIGYWLIAIEFVISVIKAKKKND